MSRYASKTELQHEIRRTIETDHNDTGLPTDCGAYNMAGVFRDIGIMGDSFYGWTTREWGREAFVQALRNNLRATVTDNKHRYGDYDKLADEVTAKLGVSR